MNIFEQLVENNLRTLEPANFKEPTNQHADTNKPTYQLEELYQKRREINDEIRLLKRSIYFFDDVLSLGRDEMPELQQFQERLKETIRTRKALNLAIASSTRDVGGVINSFSVNPVGAV